MSRQKNKGYFEEIIELNGIRQYLLHVPSQQKAVILHLHGGPGQSQAHYAFCTRAQRDYATYVYYDQRGAGKTQQLSKTPTADITLEHLIEDLRLTIQHVKERYATENVVLLGHSWGSVLGTSYILHYPGDVKGFIGVGQVVDLLRGEQIGVEKLKEIIERKGSKHDLKALARLANYPCGDSTNEFIKQLGRVRSLQSRYGLAVHVPRVLKAAIKSPIFRPADLVTLASSFKPNLKLIESLLHYSILSVSDYQTPVCYVLGENDWQVPSVLAAEYFEGINAPFKELHWVKNAGHMTDFDNPYGFHEAVEACLRGICAATINND